jgi:hypothetical protein
MARLRGPLRVRQLREEQRTPSTRAAGTFIYTTRSSTKTKLRSKQPNVTSVGAFGLLSAAAR